MIDFNKYKFSTGTHWIANSGKDEVEVHNMQ